MLPLFFFASGLGLKQEMIHLPLHCSAGVEALHSHWIQEVAGCWWPHPGLQDKADVAQACVTPTLLVSACCFLCSHSTVGTMHMSGGGSWLSWASPSAWRGWHGHRELQAPFLWGKEAVSELRLCISKVQVTCVWPRRVSELCSWALEAGGSNV